MSNANELKEQNMALVRGCFYRKPGADRLWTKSGLMKETGLSSGSVTNILQELLERKEILYSGDASSTGGRKSKLYVLNPDAHHLGMMMLMVRREGYEIRLRSKNLYGENVFQKNIFTDEGTPEKVLSSGAMLSQADPLTDRLVLSIPGTCLDGTIRECDYPDLNGFAIVEAFQERSGLRTIAENDVNIAVIGLSAAYPGYRNICLFYQPAAKFTGVGIIIDGKMYNGMSHFAGEIGYAPLYNRAQQEQLLKTDPEKLLTEQIAAVTAVLNPELAGYYSDVFDHKDLSLEGTAIPKAHWPKIVRVKDYGNLIERGGYSIGLRAYLAAGTQLADV